MLAAELDGGSCPSRVCKPKAEAVALLELPIAEPPPGEVSPSSCKANPEAEPCMPGLLLEAVACLGTAAWLSDGALRKLPVGAAAEEELVTELMFDAAESARRRCGVTVGGVCGEGEELPCKSETDAAEDNTGDAFEGPAIALLELLPAIVPLRPACTGWSLRR
jgi:hypothetical protein